MLAKVIKYYEVKDWEDFKSKVVDKHPDRHFLMTAIHDCLNDKSSAGCFDEELISEVLTVMEGCWDYFVVEENEEEAYFVVRRFDLGKA
jgi:hypothetical protein